MKLGPLRVLCVSCSLVVWLSLPVSAQWQLPYPPPPLTYSPSYGPYQPYIQPCAPSSCSYPSSPSTPCWSGIRSSQEQMYRCGLSLVYARRYYEAIQVLQNFLRDYPQSSLADNALYWIGECYYAQKQYHTALSYFQRVLFEYPRGNKVPDATLKIALTYMSLKQYAEGCRVLNDLICRYPYSEPARKAYSWLGRCGWGTRPYDGGYDVPYYGDAILPSYGDAMLPKNW